MIKVGVITERHGLSGASTKYDGGGYITKGMVIKRCGFSGLLHWCPKRALISTSLLHPSRPCAVTKQGLYSVDSLPIPAGTKIHKYISMEEHINYSWGGLMY